MFSLYIIRHGLAGKPLDDDALDEERALTKKGRDRMKDIAKGLDGLGVGFDAIVSSPLERAMETAEIVDKYCGGQDGVIYTDLLRSGTPYDGLIDFLNGLKGKENVAIVGHEPLLSGFASYCLSKSKYSFIKLKKGGILALEVDGLLKPGDCRLAWLLEPWQLVELS